MSGGPGPESGRRGAEEEVGSLGEEATRLLGSLASWAREHGAELGQEVQDLAGHVGETLHDLDDHLATGSPECTVCPVCRTLHAVRHLSPEVRTHLTAAATSLVHAAAAALAPQDPAAGGSAGTPSGDDGAVQHIDLEDNWPAEAPVGETHDGGEA